MDDILRLLCSLLLLTCPLGCTVNQQVEVLEAHLREREAEMARIAQDLERTQADLLAARQESQALRTQLTSEGKPVIPAEQAALFYRLSDLQIDSMQSTFVPKGEQGGGEFTVFVTPTDQFQTALRIPGSINLKVLSTGPGEKQILATRTFSAEEVQPLWIAGWITSGFVLQFPAEGILNATSAAGTVLLEAEFVTADGRKFTDQQELTIPQNSRFPVKKTLAGEQTVPPVTPACFEQTAPSEERPAPLAIETSDRRTLEEFPILR